MASRSRRSGVLEQIPRLAKPSRHWRRCHRPRPSAPRATPARRPRRPQEVWRRFARTSDLGEFARPTAHGGGLYPGAFDAKRDPKGGAIIGMGTRTSALSCLNFLVADALELVPDCLTYLRGLRTPEVFRFSAIPQVPTRRPLAMRRWRRAAGNAPPARAAPLATRRPLAPPRWRRAARSRRPLHARSSRAYAHAASPPARR